MTEVLLIGDTQTRLDSYALSLSATGFSVEICLSQHAARSRLELPAVQIAILDVVSIDGGWGLLCEQIHSAWPHVKVIALSPTADFSQTKLVEMGLWAPDQLLVHPVSNELLVTTVLAALGSDTGLTA